MMSSSLTRPGRTGRLAVVPVLAAAALVAVSLGAPAPPTYAAVPTGATAAAPATSPAPQRPVVATPPMGWNDWNAFGCDVSAQLVEQTADALVSSGLRDAGYRYVNIDDCWDLKQRGADGRLVPDPARFPDGIAGVADYVHARGLELGIYADAGTATCAGYPGSLGHEETDAQTFADWGVDLLKYDNCSNGGVPAAERYRAMGDALAATGRDIVYSICEWGNNRPWEWAPGLADYWRIDGDITNTWTSVRSIGRQLMRLGNGWSGPGYLDPDMLQVGNGALTPTEERTHFGLWAMYGAPLILGNDLRDIDSESLAVVSDRDVIAVDQQATGHAVRQVSAGHGQYVLARAMDDGSTVVALYNETDTSAPIATTAAEAGLPRSAAYTVRDLWDDRTTTSTGALADQVPAHGLTLLRVTPTHAAHGGTPVVTLDAPRHPGAEEYLAGPEGLAVTATVTAPARAGTLRDVSVTLDVPGGWTADGRTTRRVARLEPGRTQRWTWRLTPDGTDAGVVAARVSWAGGSGAGTREAGIRLVPTPDAPVGDTSVSALPWLRAWSGYAEPQRDVGIEGQTLAVNGTTFATGVGSHGESEIGVWLGGRCTSLTTSVGLQDGTNAGGSVRGVVVGDGHELAASGVMTAGEDAEPLTVDLRGVDYLDLHTEVGGDSSYGDRIVWGGALLTCE